MKYNEYLKSLKVGRRFNFGYRYKILKVGSEKFTALNVETKKEREIDIKRFYGLIENDEDFKFYGV